MASLSLLSEINIKPEYCPEALNEWYHLMEIGDYKESVCGKELVLKANQHLSFYGLEIWVY